MRLVLLLFIILSVHLNSNGQQSPISFSKQKRIKIINFIIDTDPNKLPVLTFTILNKTKNPIIFNRIILFLKKIRKYPISSSSNNGLISKSLTPIAGFDMELPIQEDTYVYLLRSPLTVIAKDAATFKIRMYVDVEKKHIIPNQMAFFKFSLAFLTYDFNGVTTEEISLGNEL